MPDFHKLWIPPPHNPPTDYPLAELVAKVEAALIEAPPGTKAFFKFTCGGCGARRVFETANTYFEFGECECGHKTPFVKGGFMLEIPI